jgi:hypothetical protein
MRGLMRVRRLVALICTAGAVALAVPTAASADVLVQAVPRVLTCGAAIKVGIWAQSSTTGRRRVRIRAIDRRSGRVWWRRTARAPKSHWRFWYLPPGLGGRCRSTTIVYRGAGWRLRFRVRFRREGA